MLSLKIVIRGIIVALSFIVFSSPYVGYVKVVFDMESVHCEHGESVGKEDEMRNGTTEDKDDGMVCRALDDDWVPLSDASLRLAMVGSCAI